MDLYNDNCNTEISSNRSSPELNPTHSEPETADLSKPSDLLFDSVHRSKTPLIGYTFAILAYRYSVFELVRGEKDA